MFVIFLVERENTTSDATHQFRCWYEESRILYT